MKKLFLFSAVAFALILQSCKDSNTTTTPKPNSIEVKQQQNAVFFDISATWCGPCGTYGIPAFASAIAVNEDKTVAINTHVSSSDLGTQTGQDIANAYGATSIPTLAVGNEKTGAYTDPNYTKDKLIGFANTIWAKTAMANTKIEATVTGDDLALKTHTKFFSDAETDGKYKLSVWITEDGVNNRQYHSDGTYKNIIHNHVLRSSLTPSFGMELSAEPIVKNKLFTNEFTASLAGKDKSKLTVNTVIWKEYTDTNNKTAYKFVNADKIHLQ